MLSEDVAPNSICGNRLKRFREDAKLTQAQLATRIGREQSLISDIEANLKVPTADELWEICAALDVLPHEVFSNDGQ